jgi:DNA-binding CsgD family transcriptional regulator
MAKPVKKERPAAARRQAARRQLTAMAKDLLQWRAAGLPKRKPITPAEVDRRLALFTECMALLRDPVA